MINFNKKIRNINIVLIISNIILFIVYFSIKIHSQKTREDFSSNLIDDDIYAKFYSKVFDQKEVFESNINKIDSFIDKNKYIKILNAGCGIGKHHILLKKKYKDIVGVDKSNSFVKWAKIRDPDSTFMVDDLKITNLFPSQKFSHITCFLDTIYHNKPSEMKLIFKNFNYWLKEDGFLFMNIFIKDKLDPAPREFSQYYYDEKKKKHSLTYFENFTHDAWWDDSTYVEQYINKDGKYFIKRHNLYIPHENKMIKYLKLNGFDVMDIIKYDDIDINDMFLCILKKIKI